MSNMSIKTFLTLAPLSLRDHSVLLRGPHGIGKSQVVREAAALIAAKEGLRDFPVIDRRLSQMTEGDMVGLPSTDGEVTRFNPPDWYRQACDKPVCLFLDELNRGTNEVQQAAFQIVLDRELNGWRLHDQTRVFAAVNMGASYTINDMDPALLDRFWTVDLTPTVEDWINWARRDDRVHSTVVDFIATNDKWLDAPGEVEPGKVSPSRRSWQRLSDGLRHAGVADTPNHDLFYPLCLGYVGTEATIAFHSYAKTVDSQVTGAEVLADYPKVKRKVEKLGQERMNVLLDKVADHMVKDLKALNAEQSKNLRLFATDLVGEMRVAFWTRVTQATGADNIPLTKAFHAAVGDLILEVYNMKVDPATGSVQDTADKKHAPKKTKK